MSHAACFFQISKDSDMWFYKTQATGQMAYTSNMGGGGAQEFQNVSAPVLGHVVFIIALVLIEPWQLGSMTRRSTVQTPDDCRNSSKKNLF